MSDEARLGGRSQTESGLSASGLEKEMKKSEIAFSVLQIPVDYVTTIITGLLAYFVRLQYAGSFRVTSPILFQLEPYLELIFVWSAIYLFCYAITSAYSMRRSRREIDEFYTAFIGVSVGTVVLIVAIFLSKESFYTSRFIVLIAWVLGTVMVALGRIGLRRLQIYLYRKKIGINRIVLIGKDRTSGILASVFCCDDKRGYELLEVYPAPNGNFSTAELLQKLELLHLERKIDQIIIADPNIEKNDIVNIINFADEQKIIFKYAPDLFETQATNIEVQTVAGVPLVELKRTPLEGWGKVVKRLFDIIGSTLLIVLSSPIMLFTAVAIKLDSKGPIFYLDYRTGKDGKKFIFYKFRSMRAELCDGEGPSATTAGNEMLKKLAEDTERNTRLNDPLHKIKNDPRITRLGKFIRKWSIDELPQFINVFKGDMSLVGPRPHMTLETAKYQKHHQKVFTLKPGITGMAQISGRSDLSFEDEVRLDTFYIENWSLLKDIKILLKTPQAVLRPRKVH